LMNFILHLMLRFGSSEVYLRTPSILAGALIPFVAYRWASEAFGKGVGFVAACIMSFAPPLVILSAQLRFYMVHLFWVVCSLYCLERAFRQKSVKWMRLFGVTLIVAFLTMYMSVWYTAAIAVYALARIFRKELPRRLVVEWAVTQTAAAAVFAFAWFTTLRQLRAAGSDNVARDQWLRWSYYHPEWQTVWQFTGAATQGLFRYMFANAQLAPWMLLLFLAGIVVIVWRGIRVPGKQWLPVLSLLLPLTATAAAGIARLYPYNGTRHDAFLSIFVAAGVAAAISFLMGDRVLLLTLVAACLTPLWWQAQQHHYLDDLPELTGIERLHQALDYFWSRAPVPRVLVVDQNANSYVSYYICHGEESNFRMLAEGINTYSCAGYRILQVKFWISPPGTYPAVLEIARRAAPDLFPDPVWGANFANPHGEPYWVDGKPTEDSGSFGMIRFYRLSP